MSQELQWFSRIDSFSGYFHWVQNLLSSELIAPHTHFIKNETITKYSI